MNYGCFVKEITQLVRERVPEGCEVEVNSVRKNNNVLLESMMIRSPEETVCPNIYLHSLYEQYLEGMSPDSVADRILSTYQSVVPALSVDADSLIDQEIIRSRVVYRLVNYGRNAGLLEDVPHKRFLDLALIYYVMVHNEKLGDGAVMVRHRMLAFYGLTLEEIDEAAGKNTPRLLPMDFIRISDLLREFGEKTGAQSYEEITLEEESCMAPMYVLTNTSRQFGAYYMTDRKALRRISDMLDTDLYLLPSSVHECMVVPAGMWEEPEELAGIVREINRTQVSEDEYLADTVYRFSREDETLVIAA